MTSCKRILLRLRWLGLAFVFAACADEGGNPGPTNPSLDSTFRWWSFHKLDKGGLGEQRIGDERQQVGGSIAESMDFGALELFPAGEGPNAEASVFVNETGEMSWVSVEAPTGGQPFTDAIGNAAALSQVQYFRKAEDDATLRIVVSRVLLDAMDSTPGEPTASECPWRETGESLIACRSIMRAWVSLRASAFALRDRKEFFETGGTAELNGWFGVFDYDFDYAAYTHHDAETPLWNRSSFVLDIDEELHATVRLRAPLTINVPLDSIRKGDLFYLSVRTRAATNNRRESESYLSASFRNAEKSEGLSWEFEGVEPVDTPAYKPEDIAATPAPACDHVDPEAGTLQFEADTYAAPELPGDGATIIVTRSGGSRGAVSATFSTSDGTGVADVDYAPLSTHVRFADGEQGARAVRIPLPVDATSEPNKTVNLALSDARGCAALGERTTAVLTVFDDDRTELPDVYTVGGTVTGLVGTGLVLREIESGTEVSVTKNGAFTFDETYSSGSDYEVRVGSQPVSPAQVCTIENASGLVSDQNVTNVLVTCVTTSTDGPLDVSFDDDGTVTTDIRGAVADMALQQDGKIVVIGGGTLARYDSDGALDESFGDEGTVQVVFNGILDISYGVAIQSDGRIVVVGSARIGVQDDFAVARYESNGDPDLSFGDAGVVMTDFDEFLDVAYAVRLQSDGSIVVAGQAFIDGESDFAVARYTSTGDLDTTFGDDGKVTTDFEGRMDRAYALALQPDGRIILAGRVAESGSDNADVGLSRYNTDGSPDDTFGNEGIVRVDLLGGYGDEASDLVLQPDGRIVVSVYAHLGMYAFMLARFDADGDLDPEFGEDGVVIHAINENRDASRGIALQSDGRIVVVGQVSVSLNSTFGVARYDADGEIDTDFANDGVFTVDFPSTFDGAECVAIQPDGRLVIAGTTQTESLSTVALIRLLP